MKTMEPTAETTAENRDRRPLLIVLVALVALLVGGLGGWMLSSSDGEPDDRDVLAEQIAADESRYEKTRAGQDAITQIIADPTAFGSEDQVLDLIMEHFTDDAVMDDDVYGTVPAREAWHNTLYGDLDTDINTWHRWLSNDGSRGGSLWTWSGTNFVGQPFELIGISLIEYDDDGNQSYQLVVYPYDDEYVRSTLGG